MTRDEVIEMKQRLGRGGLEALMNLEVLELIDTYLSLEAMVVKSLDLGNELAKENIQLRMKQEGR